MAGVRRTAPVPAAATSVPHKLLLVKDILNIATKDNEKVLVFSQYRAPLEMLSELLEREAAKTVSAATTASSYTHEIFSGSLPANERAKLVSLFQDPQSKLKVLLVTKGAGGVGLNLTRATRVILLEPHWNPSVDHQCICRAFRSGQTQSVYVYRLVSKGTFEEHVVHEQQRKFQEFRRIVDNDRSAESLEKRKQTSREFFKLDETRYMPLKEFRNMFLSVGTLLCKEKDKLLKKAMEKAPLIAGFEKKVHAEGGTVEESASAAK